MRRTVLALALAAVTLQPAAGRACSCLDLTLDEVLAQVDAVFVGKVTRLEIVGSRDGVDLIRAVVRTGEVFQGEVPAEVELATSNGCCYCSFEFEIAKEYLLFADEEDGHYRTSECWRSDLVGAREADLAELRRRAERP